MKFNIEDPNPDLDWPHTPSLLGIIAMSNEGARGRADDVLDRMTWHRVRDEDDEVRAVVEGSDEDDWMVSIHFDRATARCECPAFEYSDGPCKHLVASAAYAVSKREESDRSPFDWIDLSLSESRNVGRGPIWKLRDSDRKKHTPNDSDADRCGMPVETRRVGRREVTGYVTDDGSLWTGPVPIPSVGDPVLIDLPREDGLTVGEVLEHYDEDEHFYGLVVELSEAPEFFSGEEVVVFGQDVVDRETSDVDLEDRGDDDSQSVDEGGAPDGTGGAPTSSSPDRPSW